ncbi:hypothetical protein [Sulfurimonas sp. RIFCSPLOWO2_12_36_12]|uniref:hypothetical protein n=1 Tax=Sulfurimonas sp. RIFCSPLOWO2_12_36_12 TaxID=1802253 RepID=UPI0025D733FE|nr:hypothetical protein [Sulfurimonas sp. RIFCSPLOWO2_12_36_12]
MSFAIKDLEGAIAALTAADAQLQNNLAELRKLDNIAARAKALTELDTEKITEQIEKIGFTQIARKITDKLNEQLEAQSKQIYKSAEAAENAAKELAKKAENLTVVADGFNNLDNMSQDLDEFVKKFKQMSSKSLFLGVIVATVVGIFTGGVLSFAYQFGTGDTGRWLEFASKTNAVIMPINGGAYSIYLPASQSQFTLNQAQNGADVLSVYPAEASKKGGKK